VDNFEQASTVQVDVLFVVDNSESMDKVREEVKSAFDSFLLSLQDSETDFHIGVTTTDMDSTGEQGKLIEYNYNGSPYRYITASLSSTERIDIFSGMLDELVRDADEPPASTREKGLWAASQALTDVQYGGQSGDGAYNQGFLRANAQLAIIFISDEEDCSDELFPLGGSDQSVCYTQYGDLTPVSEYIEDYQRLKLRSTDVIVSAIVGPANPEEGGDCDNATSYGGRYVSAVSAFGGLVGDICQVANISGMLSEMGVSASGIRDTFTLTRVPDATSLQVVVNGVEVPPTGNWEYFAELNQLHFLEGAVPDRDSVIEVSYFPTSS
jgi:hypothetical protein